MWRRVAIAIIAAHSLCKVIYYLVESNLLGVRAYCLYLFKMVVGYQFYLFLVISNELGQGVWVSSRLVPGFQNSKQALVIFG